MLRALGKLTRSVSSLYLLLQKAFSQEADEGQDLEDWCAECVQASPQSHFWWIILHPFWPPELVVTTAQDLCAGNKTLTRQNVYT